MNILSRSSIFFGKCVTSDVASVLRIRVSTFEMDERFLMYFKEKTHVYATDPKNECKPGDYVIIREASNKNKLITHTVEKLIYRMGYTIDPLTGKKCAKNEYIDDIIRTSALFGQKPPFIAAQLEKEKNQIEKEPST